MQKIEQDDEEEPIKLSSITDSNQQLVFNWSANFQVIKRSFFLLLY